MSASVARRYVEMLERASTAPADYDVAALLRALDEALRNLDEALRAATAYVELYTPNGAKERPPEWAIDEDGSFNAGRIAAHCRAVLQHGVAP